MLAMEVDFLFLELDFSTLKIDSIFIVAELLVYNPGYYVCWTKTHKQTFVTNYPLEKNR